jgi:hypothetical protein
MRLRWTLSDLLTSDQNRLTVTFTMTVTALPDPAERQLFKEAFGTGGSEAIVNHFAPGLRAAAETLAAPQEARTAVSAEFRPAWIDALRTAAQPIAFACGVELLAPFTVEALSPSLQQEQLEQMQRTAAERRSADQMKQFQQAGELLKQWEQLKSATPSITPSQLLSQLPEGDRGGMLQTLLMASATPAGGAARTVVLWAVAGTTLIQVDCQQVDPAAPLADPRAISLPTDLGPLRSVQSIGANLLVGAQTGVYLVDPTMARAPMAFRDPQLRSEHGFSRAVWAFDGVWAIHRDGGLVGWRDGAGDQPSRVFRPEQLGGSPRNLLSAADGSAILFSVNDRLLKLDAGGSPATVDTAAAPIVGLAAVDGRLIVACEDGTVACYHAGSMHKISSHRPAGRIATVALLPWLSSARLLLAGCDGPIFSIGLDDQLIMQYGGLGGPTRAVAAVAGKVAAMTADRQRLLIWNGWEGRAPAAQVQLASLARHRIADLAFG